MIVPPGIRAGAGPGIFPAVPAPSLTGRLRRWRRLLGAGAWTAACYPVWALGALATLPSRSAARRWNGGVIRAWTRGLAAIFGVRLRVDGPPPPRPFFLVSNHLSYVDILVLGSALGPTFVSKHDIARWPVLGHLARVTGTIFVDRGRRRDAVRVLGEIDRAFHEGAGIVLFPEGTSSRGDRIYPFKSALLEWAVRSGRPVHVAALHYATDDPDHPAEHAVNWWGDAGFAPHASRLLTIRRIDASLAFSPAPVHEPDRAALAARLHDEMSSRYAGAGGPVPG